MKFLGIVWKANARNKVVDYSLYGAGLMMAAGYAFETFTGNPLDMHKNMLVACCFVWFACLYGIKMVDYCWGEWKGRRKAKQGVV